MKDTCFIDLLKEENLNKMIIDERLIDAFKQTMKNFQEYFNYMNWTNNRDYKDFFEKYLLHPYSKLIIKLSSKLDQLNCEGYYNYEKKTLVINCDYINDNSKLIDILTHEFTHFLVKNYLVENNLIKESIYNNTFINEAITEMLKMQILPLTYQSYTPQITMLKFLLIINNQKLDFEKYLTTGKICDIDSFLEELFEEYQNKLEDDDEHITNAIDNPSYLKIQRYLIKSLDTNISNIEEYKNIILKISNRPVKDIYFMNKYYKKIENSLCDKLKINDINIRRKFMFYLKEYRKVTEILGNKENFRYAASFKFDGNNYDIDDRRNVFIFGQFNNKRTILRIGEIDDNIKINIKEINLKEIKRKKLKMKEILYLKKKINLDILNYLNFISDNLDVNNNKIIKKC